MRRKKESLIMCVELWYLYIIKQFLLLRSLDLYIYTQTYEDLVEVQIFVCTSLVCKYSTFSKINAHIAEHYNSYIYSLSSPFLQYNIDSDINNICLNHATM